MNIIQIAGHLGADPETRFIPSGLKVTTLRVATNIRRKDKEETIWWRVTLWGDRFDKLLTYLKKGSTIIVVGEMGKPEIYTDKEGNPQVSLEITAEMIRFNPFPRLEKADQQGSGGYSQNAASGEQPSASGRSPYNSGSQTSFGQAQSGSNTADDESLPF